MTAVSPGPPARLAITGSSGLYGRAVIAELRRVLPAARVLGVDLHPVEGAAPDEFWRGSITAPGFPDAVAAFAPDTLVHLAFAVQPGRSARTQRAANIDGTNAVLDVAARVAPRRLLVASSGTVYGAWPDNPPACDESATIRPLPGYYYSAHKGIVERLVADFAAAYPDVAVSVTRPAIVVARGVRNFLTDYFLGVPFLGLPDGRDTPLQFVHRDDLARATVAILTASARGAFNVAPDDAITHRQVARALGVPAIPLPYAAMVAVGRLWWTLRLPWLATPPGLVGYVRHPWVMTSRRLREELGFAFAHTCAEAFDELVAGDDQRRR
ncbi:MAG: NAD-dependent epimerase/dehydratase family protein [Planctomycetaceae bacterium]